jgi:hypothetical protein
MGIVTGKVVEGKVLVDGMELPEGAVVTVVTREPSQGVQLMPDEEARLLEAVAEADCGETVPAEELFDRLDRAAGQ